MLLIKKSTIDISNPSNYRLISHIPSLSKLIERIVSTQLIDYLITNNIIDTFQGDTSMNVSLKHHLHT